MGVEQGVDYYNRTVMCKTKNPKLDPMFPIWKAVLENIDGEHIIDLGCGEGLFALYATNRRKKYLVGIDFSDRRIRNARQLNPKLDFVIKSLYDDNIYGMINKHHNRSVIVMCELLEHLQRDIYVLDKIKKGSKLIITVPSFLCKAHVRCFKNKDQIIERYDRHIDIEAINILKKLKRDIFLIIGRKK